MRRFCFCIAKAAIGIDEFYTLPVGEKLLQYDKIAVSVIVKNRLIIFLLFCHISSKLFSLSVL